MALVLILMMSLLLLLPFHPGEGEWKALPTIEMTPQRWLIVGATSAFLAFVLQQLWLVLLGWLACIWGISSMER